MRIKKKVRKSLIKLVAKDVYLRNILTMRKEDPTNDVNYGYPDINVLSEKIAELDRQIVELVIIDILGISKRGDIYKIPLLQRWFAKDL